MFHTKPRGAVRRAPVVLLLPALASAALVAGCGSSTAGHAASTPAKPNTPAKQQFAMQVLTSKMAAKDGYLGPDGNGHDTFMLANLASAQASNPQVRSNLDVNVGSRVTVTVTNYDEGPHTFTVPGLGVTATIKAATDPKKGIPSTTTFTFTAKKSGKFRWYCALPCDAKHKSWAMSEEKGEQDQVGYMAGYVVAA